MFAADYPFESAQEAGEFMDHVPLAEPLRADIALQQCGEVSQPAHLILRHARSEPRRMKTRTLRPRPSRLGASRRAPQGEE